MFKLKLQNYRGFLNEEFDFSRINILIGENSAGKSSVLKFLLALKQSLYRTNKGEYNLTLSDFYADLGNYYETVYNHEIDRKLGFSFEFGKDYVEYYTKAAFDFSTNNKQLKQYVEGKLQLIDTPTIVNYEFSNDLSKHNNISLAISNANVGILHFNFDNQTPNNKDAKTYHVLGNSTTCDIIFENFITKQTFHITDVNYTKDGFLTILDNTSLANQIKFNQDIYFLIHFLSFSQFYIARQLMQIDYINPLLYHIPDRLYIQKDNKKINYINNIRDLINFLESPDSPPDFKAKLLTLLADFGLAEDFEIKNAGIAKEFRIKLHELDNNIKDVGFGVSLQLPIFAQALLAEMEIYSLNKYEQKGKTLLIEQPEVHLHPRLQAKFIETLLGIGNHNVYFIETHSEHIIRMLQVLVKTKKFDLKSTDVSIHYFRKEGKQMVKTAHKIDENTGKLKPNFPKGFYDVSYDLAFQLMD